MTFAKYNDKDHVMKNKRKLPDGIYINDEYPIEVKRNRDILRPILKLAKGIPHYRDKCKLTGDRLIVNSITYTVDDMTKLPADLAPI